MGPFCKNPGRVLLNLLMVGLLSQVMDKANGSVIVNMVNKNIEPVCDREVKDNVGVLAVCHGVDRESINSRLEELEALSVESIFL
jgi:hypothetical protein